MAVGREKRPDSDKDEKNSNCFTKFDFNYCENEDVFVCPDGKKLHLKHSDKEGKRTYSGNKDECLNCQYRSKCCKSKKGEPRTVSSDEYEPLRDEMREKMKQKSSKEIYSRRKVVVEPVFGQIKNQSFRRFHLRGLNKVSGEFALVCSAHNLRKIVRHGDRGMLVPSQLVKSNFRLSEVLRKNIRLISSSIKNIIQSAKKMSPKSPSFFFSHTF